MTGRQGQSGGVLVLVALSLTVLLGIAALAIDTGNFRAHRRQLQSAADAGALAGAAQLIANPGAVCGAGGRADYYERRNSDLTDGHNLIENANLDTSYCEIVNNSVRVKPVESDVPFVFGKVLGFLNTDISARARARIVYLTTARGMMPIGVEDLRPKTVQVIRDDTGAVVASLTSGCGSSPDGFLYYCGGGTVNSLPAGGVPVHVRVTDVTGTVIDFANDGSGNPIGVGWIGTEDVPKSGATSCACTVKEVYVTQGIADPSLYYPFTTTARSFGVNVHLTNVPNGAQVRVQLNGGPGQGAQASRTSGTNADGQWSTGASAFSTATSEGPENVTVTVKQGNTTYTSHTVQRIYPHDQSTLLYSYTQSGAAFGGRFVSSSLAAGAPGRTVNFQTAFVTLVKGREIVLKLGGGNAASPGNFGALDLDTNSSWPQYQCYAGNGTPNFADELYHGACTPYSIGQQVQTQTGNQVGQIDGGNGGLTRRIGNSPNHWTTTANPPPAGDPRWVNVILVGPLSIEALNGNSTTPVVGFGNFYITAYSRDAGSGLKNGEVRGIFWDRVNPSGAYSTTCTDPSGICLESIALMPWDG
jgi:hypothetical protein